MVRDHMVFRGSIRATDWIAYFTIFLVLRSLEGLVLASDHVRVAVTGKSIGSVIVSWSVILSHGPPVGSISITGWSFLPRSPWRCSILNFELNLLMRLLIIKNRLGRLVLLCLNHPLLAWRILLILLIMMSETVIIDLLLVRHIY